MNFILPKLNVSIERWKFNPEYKLYVSNMGNVRNKNKQPIKLKVNSSGYMMTSSRVSVHRLVMQTWKPIENNKNMTVDHLNHNKRDNRLTNLEWVTKAENQRRATEDYIQLSCSSEPKTQKSVKKFFIEHPEMKKYFSMSINCSNDCNTITFATPEEAATYLKEKDIAIKNNGSMQIDHIARKIILAAINNKAAFNYDWGFQKEGE